MELTQEFKDLLNAYEMASVSDFIDEENVEYYLENTDLDLKEIGLLCEKYNGWSISSLEETIINKLREL